MAINEAFMKNGDHLNKEWEDLMLNVHWVIFIAHFTLVNNDGNVLGDIYSIIMNTS